MPEGLIHIYIPQDNSLRPFVYLLKRSARRRTIGLKVSAKGISVSAPWATPQSEIEDFLRKFYSWIVTHYELNVQRMNMRESRRRSFFRDGAVIPFRGRDLAIRLRPSAKQPLLMKDGDEALVLQLPLAEDASEEAVRAVLLDWLKREAARVIEGRFRLMESRAGRNVETFGLTDARTFWGICRARKRIRLNWRLIFFGNDVIDYVAAHELAHIDHMDHSAAFWERVREIKPDFERGKDILRETSSMALPD